MPQNAWNPKRERALSGESAQAPAPARASTRAHAT